MKERLIWIGKWHTIKDISNPNTKFDPSQIQLLFKNLSKQKEIEADEILVTLENDELEFEINLESLIPRGVYVSLLYLSFYYEVCLISSIKSKISEGQKINLFTNTLEVPEGKASTIDRLKLFVSTEPLDDFLFVQENKIEIGKVINLDQSYQADILRSTDTIIESDWFCKDMKIITSRRDG